MMSPVLTMLRKWRMAKPEPEIQVLMVCLGNICRSPTAEAVLRHKLAQSGLGDRVGVASAGTHGERGAAPDARSIAVAARRGYDLASIRSRRVVPADFERYHHVLAMDRDNLGHLQAQCPEPLRSRLGLLLHHAPACGLHEVPDPYYGGPAGFDRVLDLVETACDGLVGALRGQLAQRGQGNFRG